MPFLQLQLSHEANAKDNRIRSLSYFFKRNLVVLKEGLDDLKRELNRYPGNTRSKNDLVDALSMQKSLISWRRVKNYKEVEYVRPKQTYKSYFNMFNKSGKVYSQY